MNVVVWFSLFAFATSKVADKTGCPPVFGGRCSCGNVSDQYHQVRFLVECISTGFTNSSMLRQLPEDTEKLVFRGNYIEELPVNVFGEEDEAPINLEIVDLSENNIRLIHGKTFHHVSGVTRLILNHNEIHITGKDHRDRLFSNFDSLEELHMTNAFSGKEKPHEYLVDLEFIFIGSQLTNLRSLHMEQNMIYFAPSNKNLMCPLKSLEQLHLSDNALTDITLNLSCLPLLLFVGVQRNRIQALSDNTIRHLDNLPNGGRKLTIDLTDNPFRCDCDFKRTLDWMKRTNITLRDKYKYTCASGHPETNRGMPLELVSILECPPEIAYQQPAHYKSANIVLAIVLGLMLGLFVLLLYVNRAILKTKLYPMWNYITRKVRYSSLEEVDEPEVHI